MKTQRKRPKKPLNFNPDCQDCRRKLGALLREAHTLTAEFEQIVKDIRRAGLKWIPF